MYTTMNDALRIAREHLPSGITIGIYLRRDGCEVEIADEPGGQGYGREFRNVKNLELVFERALDIADELAKELAELRNEP